MLLRLALRLGANIAAIFVASAFVDGVDYADDWVVLVVTGVVFAVARGIHFHASVFTRTALR